jgi:hypothetical protein
LSGSFSRESEEHSFDLFRNQYNAFPAGLTVPLTRGNQTPAGKESLTSQWEVSAGGKRRYVKEVNHC